MTCIREMAHLQEGTMQYQKLPVASTSVNDFKVLATCASHYKVPIYLTPSEDFIVCIGHIRIGGGKNEIYWEKVVLLKFIVISMDILLD